MKRPLAALGLLACLAAAGGAQTPPPKGTERPGGDVADLVNALLGALMGSSEVTGERLQAEDPAC